jgi:serine/threonine protein phosphatase 1
MRTIAIGDIHGCYTELQQLLAKVKITEADCLISLGDIVDRGPDSVKVYDFLKDRPNTVVLMGNHERKHLLQTLSYSQDIVKVQFGERYPEFVEWVDHLPYYYETDTAIFVHAAVEAGIPITEQREEVLCGCTAGEKYLQKHYGETYWSQLYTDPKPVIFGHHVTGDHPLVIDQRVFGIDTGACHGGRLTALILPSFEIIQVQASQDYWQREAVKWQLPVFQAKPWSSYKWEKILGLCDEFRDSDNLELAAFIRQQEQWVQHLWAHTPQILTRVNGKLAELVAIHGADEFKKPARQFGYAGLMYEANAGHLTAERLPKSLPTPDRWLETMAELNIPA